MSVQMILMILMVHLITKIIKTNGTQITNLQKNSSVFTFLHDKRNFPFSSSILLKLGF